MDGKVVVIGSLNYDIILKTDRMPLKGETHNAESAQCCCGGKGGNHTLEQKDVDEIAHLLDGHTVLILQMEIPVKVLEYAIKTAARAGCNILFNMAPAMDFDETYMKMCHFLIMNEVEAQFYTGKEITSVPAARSGLTEFAGKMGNTCIFTLGKQGAMPDIQEVLDFRRKYSK